MSDKKLHAKHLYFQTELNKTQIADVLNISRRTLHYWIREGNWERLKRSSEHMPSLIAENCYHIMAHLTNSYLSERRLTNPVTPKEIDALHKLILTINKLKSRAALNEHVETFGLFIDKIRQKAPDVAEKVAPFVEEYLEERAAITAGSCTPPHFNDMGYIPMNDTTDYEEQQLDNHDSMAWDTDGLIAELQDVGALVPRPVIIPDEDRDDAPNKTVQPVCRICATDQRHQRHNQLKLSSIGKQRSLQKISLRTSHPAHYLPMLPSTLPLRAKPFNQRIVVKTGRQVHA
jgi:hypothetical protein